MGVHPQTENLIFAPDGTSYIGQKEMSDSNLDLTLCINVTVEDDAELSHKVEQLCFNVLEKHLIEQSSGSVEDDFEDALKQVNTEVLRLRPGKKKMKLLCGTPLFRVFLRFLQILYQVGSQLLVFFLVY